ncbi:MAG: hypothetical protein IKJ58_09810, partial [Akkermansia sp.]|nr:hypothetical protein [Akkermansia sp.]
GVLVLFFHTPIMSCNRAFPKHHFCHPVSLFAIRDNSCIRFLWDGNDLELRITKARLGSLRSRDSFIWTLLARSIDVYLRATVRLIHKSVY